MVLDVRQLRRAGREMRGQLPRAVRLKMAKDLRTVGRTIATEAVAAARFHIDPDVLKVRTRGPSVRIQVTKTEPKPHAGKAHAFEHSGEPGQFRHPVYGNKKRWVSQEARPFLTPTAEVRFGWAYARIGEIVDGAFRDAGFH